MVRLFLRPRRRRALPALPTRPPGWTVQPGWTVHELAAALQRHVDEGGDPDAPVLVALDGPPGFINDDAQRVLDSYNWTVVDHDWGDGSWMILNAQPDLDEEGVPLRTRLDDRP